MSEELGRIEKPAADNFKKGRKLYFIPVIYCGEESPKDYLELFNRYWEQVKHQINELELKLGKVDKIFHELVSSGGEDSIKTIEKLNEHSHSIVQTCRGKGAQMEGLEEEDLLTELMDWSRCLLIGLQNQKVLDRVHEAYQEVSKKRNTRIANNIDKTLKPDEIGILLMREIHQIKLPSDIQVFYIAPPALNEIEHWFREHQDKQDKSAESGT